MCRNESYRRSEVTNMENNEENKQIIEEPQGQDFMSALDLCKLGIDPSVTANAMAMIPKFVADFVRGVPQFVFEEKAVQESLRSTSQEKLNLLVQTIFSVRAFLLTVMGFSLTAIGIVLSVLSSEHALFGHLQWLYVGMVALGLNVIGSVIYILYIHTLEGNALLRQLNFDRSLARELQDLLQAYYVNPAGTFDQYLIAKKILIESKKEEEKALRPQRKKDWIPHVLGSLFLVGVLLIIVSFFWR